MAEHRDLEHSPAAHGRDARRRALEARGSTFEIGQRRKPGVFPRFARGTAHLLGSPLAFVLAVVVVLVWSVCGPFFGFSDSWQLVINTSTTIVTFLMVFVIQSTQNRDSRALQIKLDALIDALPEAREEIVDIEDAPDEEIDAARADYIARRDAEVNGEK